jgi:drug/metabolite transporter (DMT)-like permease
MPRQDRRALRDTGALGAGTAVTGALAYAFAILAIRTLGAEGAAPVSVLSTCWSVAAAVLTFPLQH